MTLVDELFGSRLAEIASSVFTPWSNFYVMIGSAAGALTGLMFVVITLVTREERSPTRHGEGIATFSTPTVIPGHSLDLVAFPVLVARAQPRDAWLARAPAFVVPSGRYFEPCRKNVAVRILGALGVAT